MQINLAYTLPVFVRGVLPKFSGDSGKGVRVSISARLTDFAGDFDCDDEVTEIADLTFIIFCPRTYVAVWASHSRSADPKDFKRVAFHDSAWSEAFQKELQVLKDDLESAYSKKWGHLYPKGVDFWKVSFRVDVDEFDLVDVEIKPDGYETHLVKFS